MSKRIRLQDDKESSIKPVIFFGTGTKWGKGFAHNIEGDVDQSLVTQVLDALNVGFRNLDLAEIYGNEREVGIALKEWVGTSNNENKRSDLWITSKVWFKLDDIVNACKETIGRLGCEYLDLYLIHAPIQFKKAATLAKTGKEFEGNISSCWKQMEQLVEMGLVRNIGVSNFRRCDLEEVISIANKPIYANQVEFHPYLQQPKLHAYCHSKGIRTQAYSSLASLNLFPNGPVDAVVKTLAEKYKTSEATILIRYTQQKNITVNTTSTKQERLKEYLLAGSGDSGVTLTAKEIDTIDLNGRKQHSRKYWGSDFKDVIDSGEEEINHNNDNNNNNAIATSKI